ncbi:MAG: hypothetical protein ACR2H1_02295 [Limisphaerales bacterium]
MPTSSPGTSREIFTTRQEVDPSRNEAELANGDVHHQSQIGSEPNL